MEGLFTARVVVAMVTVAPASVGSNATRIPHLPPCPATLCAATHPAPPPPPLARTPLTLPPLSNASKAASCPPSCQHQHPSLVLSPSAAPRDESRFVTYIHIYTLRHIHIHTLLYVYVYTYVYIHIHVTWVGVHYTYVWKKGIYFVFHVDMCV